MAVRFRHTDFPVPRLLDLASAIARRRYSAMELYLIAASLSGLLVFGAWWAALLVPSSAIAVDWIASERVHQLVRSWRAARKRRIELNGIDLREMRRAALAEHLAGLVDQADRAWRAYIADATTGRTQSVINDRPAPKIQPLRQLASVRDEAHRLNIVLEAETSPPASDRLIVPPQASFAPDILSPTMMNLNAASIDHAKREGAVRAELRHRRAVEHAAEFGPLLLFAEEAVKALRHQPAKRKARPRRWPWRRRARRRRRQ